jgi:hypothetical protein
VIANPPSPRPEPKLVLKKPLNGSWMADANTTAAPYIPGSRELPNKVAKSVSQADPSASPQWRGLRVRDDKRLAQWFILAESRFFASRESEHIINFDSEPDSTRQITFDGSEDDMDVGVGIVLTASGGIKCVYPQSAAFAAGVPRWMKIVRIKGGGATISVNPRSIDTKLNTEGRRGRWKVKFAPDAVRPSQQILKVEEGAQHVGNGFKLAMASALVMGESHVKITLARSDKLEAMLRKEMYRKGLITPQEQDSILEDVFLLDPEAPIHLPLSSQGAGRPLRKHNKVTTPGADMNFHSEKCGAEGEGLTRSIFFQGCELVITFIEQVFPSLLEPSDSGDVAFGSGGLQDLLSQVLGVPPLAILRRGFGSDGPGAGHALDSYDQGGSGSSVGYAGQALAVTEIARDQKGEAAEVAWAAAAAAAAAAAFVDESFASEDAGGGGGGGYRRANDQLNRSAIETCVNTADGRRWDYGESGRVTRRNHAKTSDEVNCTFAPRRPRSCVRESNKVVDCFFICLFVCFVFFWGGSC